MGSLTGDDDDNDGLWQGLGASWQECPADELFLRVTYSSTEAPTSTMQSLGGWSEPSL